jgi:hypothetical protein
MDRERPAWGIPEPDVTSAVTDFAAEALTEMHVQVATYRIDETSDADFIEANREFASMMTEVPGLLAKIWLKAPAGNVYGGIYLWRDRQAYEEFVGGELWASVGADETVFELDSRDYAVMEELTRETQRGLRVV